jgi:hypothetical protein
MHGAAVVPVDMKSIVPNLAEQRRYAAQIARSKAYLCYRQRAR